VFLCPVETWKVGLGAISFAFFGGNFATGCIFRLAERYLEIRIANVPDRLRSKKLHFHSIRQASINQLVSPFAPLKLRYFRGAKGGNTPFSQNHS